MIKKIITYKICYLVYITAPNESLPPISADCFGFSLKGHEVCLFDKQQPDYTTYIFYPTKDLSREQILSLETISQREILFFTACAFLNERIDMAKELLLSSMHKDFIQKFYTILKKKDHAVAYDHIMSYLKGTRPTMLYERPFEQVTSCTKDNLFKLLKEHHAYIDKSNDDLQPAQWNTDLMSFMDKDQIRVRVDERYIDSFEKATGLNHLKWIGGENTDYYTFEITLQP